jgi:hypothetical protein
MLKRLKALINKDESQMAKLDDSIVVEDVENPIGHPMPSQNYTQGQLHLIEQRLQEQVEVMDRVKLMYKCINDYSLELANRRK